MVAFLVNLFAAMVAFMRRSSHVVAVPELSCFDTSMTTKVNQVNIVGHFHHASLKLK